MPKAATGGTGLPGRGSIHDTAMKKSFPLRHRVKLAGRLKSFFFRVTYPTRLKLQSRANRKLFKKSSKEIAKTDKWLNWAMDGTHGLSLSDVDGINKFREVLFLESKLYGRTVSMDEDILDEFNRARRARSRPDRQE